MARSLRSLFGLIGAGLGFYGMLQLGGLLKELLQVPLAGAQASLGLAAGALLGGLIGFLLGPLVVRRVVQFTAWLQGRLFRIPTQDIVTGAIGLIVGLMIAYLLRPALQPVPLVGSYLPLAASILMGYLGWVVAVHKRDDLFGLSLPLSRGGERGRERGARAVVAPKILDTSAIIDGRIAEICQAGFVEGPLIIPTFVLDELRHIADSPDALKRNRGRRGLDILNRMQKELQLPVEISDRDASVAGEVDVKLVKLARKMNGHIITNDFNLNKVAGLHGVQVLNINELANAIKSAVLPGEEMIVQVIKDGKEIGQGVAYLDDGTMIVVDGGKRYIGERIGVEVTSVLQTSAGRMIFARPKPSADEVAARVSTS